MNDGERLQNKITFYDYHKNTVKSISDLDIIKGSNLDMLLKYIDAYSFNQRLNLDEQDKAYDLDYAHGLELDNKGSIYNVYRNGLDDDTYRFLIKSHILSLHSKGTLPEIIRIASNLLGCQPQDIHMHNARQYKNGKVISDNGLVNTVMIDSINIEKVLHANLIPSVVNELKHSMASGYTISKIGFSTAIKGTMYTGGAVSLVKSINI